MRCLLRGLVGACVAASTATVFGQAGSLPNLSSRLEVIRFSIAEGRIEVNADQPDFEREQTSTIEPGHHETLSISTNNENEASLKYELATEAEQLSVNVVDGYNVSLSRHPTKRPHAAQVDFSQPRTGPITLTVEQDGVRREVQGETVWYLLLAEPELCRQHLLPLLSMFRSNWRLLETAQAIESQMLRTAASYQPKNLRRWSVLVGNLAGDRFVVRQAAERELRADGTTVIPFLQSLDRRQLDLEQTSRIDGIVDTQADLLDNTPEQEACRLMDNRSLWIVLLSRPQENTRCLAARQLAFLMGGKSVPFDPGAAEPVRKAQVESMRKRVEADTAPKPSDGAR